MRSVQLVRFVKLVTVRRKEFTVRKLHVIIDTRVFLCFVRIVNQNCGPNQCGCIGHVWLNSINMASLSTESDKLKTWIIVLIVTGTVVLVLLVIIAVLTVSILNFWFLLVLDNCNQDISLLKNIKINRSNIE